ncbi:histidine phosphatase family protein [Aeromicrobium sp. CF3.5]|uniref:histidine phosphatase family protein n=1 Tax=Aeromicrobium sp. CF3.5 TaxID=3373078 RepID=UPI003EE5599A
MATVILIRHGRTTANASGVLAGRTAGVKLDHLGRDQARRAGERLASVPLAAIVSSPLERCRQTSRAIAREQVEDAPPLSIDKGIVECDYGDWQGGKLADLGKKDLWKVVQSQPSAVTFPGGESLPGMQARSVAAIRRHDAAIEAEHGSQAVWAAVSHGDIIKSILADALGMHLDLFQRIHVDPASISIVRYAAGRTTVLASNTHAGDLSWLRPNRDEESASGGAPIGGGAGPGAEPPHHS